MNQLMTTKTYTLMLALALSVTMSSSPLVFAAHDDEGISNYIWSRATSDGHRSLLNCQSSPNADRCDIEFDIASNIDNIAGSLSTSQIGDESDNAVSTVNAINVYIDVNEVSSSSYDVTASNLGLGSTAQYTYDRHCTNFFIVCWANDSHFIDFDIQVNTNSSFDFATSETCSGEIPSKWDLEKTLGHEYFHMFGVEHSSDGDSITYSGGYNCDNGESVLAHDEFVVDDHYPSGVT